MFPLFCSLSISDVVSNCGPEEKMEQNPILTCRRRSRSIWLHFPHLELLFLFWAFEGAVAAQVSAIRTAECPWVFWLALAALVRGIFKTHDQAVWEGKQPTRTGSLFRCFHDPFLDLKGGNGTTQTTFFFSINNTWQPGAAGVSSWHILEMERR